MIQFQAHNTKVNSIDFNKLNPNLFLSTSKDNTAAFWDLRNTKIKLHSFYFDKTSTHKTFQEVKWSLNSENIFAVNNRNAITIWDISKLAEIKDYQGENEAIEGLSVFYLLNVFKNIYKNDSGIISCFDWMDLNEQNSIILCDSSGYAKILKF